MDLRVSNHPLAYMRRAHTNLGHYCVLQSLEIVAEHHKITQNGSKTVKNSDFEQTFANFSSVSGPLVTKPRNPTQLC